MLIWQAVLQGIVLQFTVVYLDVPHSMFICRAGGVASNASCGFGARPTPDRNLPPQPEDPGSVLHVIEKLPCPAGTWLDPPHGTASGRRQVHTAAARHIADVPHPHPGHVFQSPTAAALPRCRHPGFTAPLAGSQPLEGTEY